jgi:transcriptional regulator with XRE-family HTH domain
MPRDVFQPDILLRVLGSELRDVRRQRGWARADLRARLGSQIALQTLATYELGTRNIAVVRLVELCAALGVSAPDLLERTLQRTTDLPAIHELRLDLHRLATSRDYRLGPVRRWARACLTDRADPAASVGLSRLAIAHLADVCGLGPAELVRMLRRSQAEAS